MLDVPVSSAMNAYANFGGALGAVGLPGGSVGTVRGGIPYHPGHPHHHHLLSVGDEEEDEDEGPIYNRGVKMRRTRSESGGPEVYIGTDRNGSPVLLPSTLLK